MPGYNRTATVHSQFQITATYAQDNPALLSQGRVMSYAGLDHLSNQLARVLQGHGVRRGDFVAILADRSIDVIVAILGILKAGAAYVPLDASYPAERLSFMIADSAPSLILVDSHVPAHLFAPRPTVLLDEVLATAASEADTPLPCECAAEDVAYLMYTSGSTGRPKGVLTCHRSIVRLIKDQDYAPFGPNETVLHLAPLAFDASTFEIWGALLNGAQLGIVCDTHPSLDTIVDSIARYRATVAWFTAGLFHLLVDQKLEGLRPLRCIMAGGDVLSPAHIGRAYAALPDCQIVNGYGPTENTTFTCCYPIPRSGWGGGTVPIGREIGHTQVHLLGPDLTPVANGELGQICCAGDGLSKGYLNRPDLTTERFVPSPFSASPDDHLYLTGDIGRRRPDGVIEFCGRVDRQIKINGKRVELEEIENALRRDPALADAAVVARGTTSGSKRLTAYLKPAAPWPSGVKGARVAAVLARLRVSLPDYMVPPDAVVLNEFPLTPNGKLDRDALPLPDSRQRQAEPARIDTKVEVVISEIWSRILDVRGFDPGTNFFDLGGTSLQLLEVHAELQAKLRPDVPLMALFAHTTVRELARHLGQVQPERSQLARSWNQPRPLFASSVTRPIGSDEVAP